MDRVLISGAGGNLGKACVDIFLKNNFEVIGTVSPGKATDKVGNYRTVGVDLGNEKKVNEALQPIINEGGINAAVLTVGGFTSGKLTETTAESLQKMMQLNFDTTFFAAKILFDHMLTSGKGGRMVLIGARPALIPDLGKDLAAYALSKSLIFRLAEMMNSEGHGKNFHASVIAPGTIDTRDNRKWKPEGDPSWVTPEEIGARIFKIIRQSKPGDDYVITMYSPAYGSTE